MKIILMGSSEWVIPAFNRAADEHDVIAVFTRPPAAVGRKKIITKTPVHLWAESRGIPVETDISAIPGSRQQAKRVVGWVNNPRAPTTTPNLIRGRGWVGQQSPGPDNNPELDSGTLLGGAAIDFIVVASYGVILKNYVLNLAPIVNIHPSLLPMYRGPSPMLSAIYNGDAESGVCLMKISAKVDAGDIYNCEKFDIEIDDTIIDIENKVAKISAEMLSEFLSNPEKYPPHPQLGTPTFTRKFNGGDEWIDWKKTPAEVHNQVRSIGGRTKINGIDVKILKTKIADEKLVIEIVQPAGKKPMDWKSFVNGQRGVINYD